MGFFDYKNKGITLIALIVTIIILLILAGVSIATLGGENGLITQAIRAKQESEKAVHRENIGLIIQEEQMNKISKNDDSLFIEQLAQNISQQTSWVKAVAICDSEFQPTSSNAEKVIIIIVDTKDGYEITIKVDNINIKAEIVSIIKGKAKTYKVTYHANNGTNEKVEVEIREGFSTEAISNTYEKQGYEFIGWSTNKDTEDVEYVEGNKIENIKENIDLYAIWSKNTVTITFHGNSKTYTQPVDKGASVPLKLYSTTGINYTGYLFKGWSKTEGGQVEYTDGQTVTLTEDIDLYGVFEQDSVTATLSITKGGSSTNKLTKGTTIKINATSTKTGISNIKLEMVKNNSVVAKIYEDNTVAATKAITLDGLEEELINLNKLTIFNTYECRLTATTETGAKIQQKVNLTDYTVASANDLNVLATNVNNGTTYSGETIILVKDITTTENYVPIGYYDEVGIYTGKYFAGIFEGNNHTITLTSMTTNITKYRSSGIFGMVIGGEVYNLTVEGSNTAALIHSAGIVGCIKDGKIINCVNNCTLTDTTKGYRGGIVGTALNSQITGCENKSKINGSAAIGGICGYSYEATKIDNCSNSGRVVSSGNTGIIWDRVNIYYGYGISGGIVGQAVNTDVSNCSNSANISGTDKCGTLSGGIVGFATDNTKIKLSKNTGTILYYLTSGESTNGGALGGIVGFANKSSIEECYNDRLVTSLFPPSQNKSMNNIGGIVGYANSATVKNCYNLKSVRGNNNVGGIVGIGEFSTFNNCYNATEDIEGNGNFGIYFGYCYLCTGTNNSCMEVSDPGIFSSTNSECTWSNYKEYSLEQMKTLNSGLLTLMNSGDGAGLWAQSTSINDGLPYLKNLKP